MIGIIGNREAICSKCIFHIMLCEFIAFLIILFVTIFSEEPKSITAREVFAKHPEVKKKLWGGEFWSDGYFVSTVGKHGNESVISNYVKNQGTEGSYKTLSKQPIENIIQLSLFD